MLVIIITNFLFCIYFIYGWDVCTCKKKKFFFCRKRKKFISTFFRCGMSYFPVMVDQVQVDIF